MKYTRAQRDEILSRLLKLSQEGKINGVWSPDRTGVQIRTARTGEPDYIPWSRAAELTHYRQAPAEPDFKSKLPDIPEPRRPFQKTLRPQPGRRGQPRTANTRPQPAPPITLSPGIQRHPRSAIVRLARQFEQERQS